MSMQVLGIIPARFSSTRFPGKPLVMIAGKPMIQRVYEQASKVIDNVVVATDDARIFENVKHFGGNVVMTSENHKSGTDRCAEAYAKFNFKADVVVNIQGDEPFLQPEQLKLLIECFQNTTTDIATLVKKITDYDAVFDSNKVKAIFDKSGYAIYFSRSPIPFVRNAEKENWHTTHPFYKHIGVYAYRVAVLNEITKLQPSLLEIAESLEQNRWIENGYKISIKETDIENLAVDTPEDLNKIMQEYGKGFYRD